MSDDVIRCPFCLQPDHPGRMCDRYFPPDVVTPEHADAAAAVKANNERIRTERRGAPLCPEAEYRASLSEADFWAHVLGVAGEPGREQEYDPDEDPNRPDDADDFDGLGPANPCPTCGSTGACAYDADGRALIHAVPTDDRDGAPC